MKQILELNQDVRKIGARKARASPKLKDGFKASFLPWFCSFQRSQLSDQMNVEILEALCVLYKSDAQHAPEAHPG
jgi:hypothetical protein